MNAFMVPAGPYQKEHIVKNSRFITFLEYVASPEAVRVRLKELRVNYPDCSHICYAYIAASPQTTLIGMSDDGEPSGTAGKPMLNVLMHENVGYVLVAIIRYFGGTKLGTGGLQRAYSECTQDAVANANWQQFKPQKSIRLECEFALEANVRHILAQYEAIIDEVYYAMSVQFKVTILEDSEEALIKALIDICAASIKITNVQ